MSSSTPYRSVEGNRRKPTANRGGNGFIDFEADVSDDCFVSGDDEHDDDNGSDLEGFLTQGGNSGSK